MPLTGTSMVQAVRRASQRPPPGGSGITVELGFAMMVLAAVWSIFRQEVLRYQLRFGTALYDLPKPPDAAQVRAAEYTGTFLRLLLVVLGFIIVLATLALR